MKAYHFTIARWMGLIAAFSVNAGFVRAYLVQEMFHGVVLIFIALQVGLFCLLRSRGSRRRFWWGFEVSGMSYVLVLVYCELLPESPLNRLVTSYMGFATGLAFDHLPVPLADHLDEHQDQLFDVACFVPAVIAALLGGVIAVRLLPMRPAASSSMDQGDPNAMIG